MLNHVLHTGGNTMAFTLEDLLPADQQLRTVQPHETVDWAVNVMFQHGYSQLPVAGPNKEFQGQVITFESVLRAIQSFHTEAKGLLVRDAAHRVRSYAPDADLLATLDDIHRDNFALIVDDSGLVGIVTTADMAVFFREYAQDLMVIEGIESRVKDAIRALYAGDDDGLESAIVTVTDRAADIRKKVPGAIKAYLGKAGISPPPAGTDIDALAEAEKRLGLQEPSKKFEDLTFDEFINVLLRHPRAPRLSQSKEVSEVRGLFQQVRDARNKLAHFRGELIPAERRTIQFAAEWLENNLPVPPDEMPLMPVHFGSDVPTHQEEGESPQGSYAPLAAYLEALPVDTPSVALTFQQIEGILKKELPRSAYEYRAWWSNDPMKPQSVAWLDEGWRTTSVSMTERRLTFVRTNDREEAYISFFAKLNARLATVTDFPLRNVSPQGQSWIVLASLDRSWPELATIAASFARRKRLRIELYLDGANKDANKRRFELLLTRKSEFEQVVGEPLQWERMDDRRACRIAVYTKAQILTDADSPTLLEWATKKATSFYRAFEPEFSPGRSFE
jgi:predicted transcriptional regulator